MTLRRCTPSEASAWEADPTSAPAARVVRVRGPLVSKDRTMDAFADALELPEWFGRNWDALADVLAECRDTALVIDGWQALPAEVADPLEALIDVVTSEPGGPLVYAIVDDRPAHPTVERVRAAAAERGLAIDVVHFDEHTRTAQDAADAVGVAVGQIVKSLVFRARGGPHDGPIVALVSGANQCDTDRLAVAAGADRIERADAELVRSATGFAIGGVPPFGYPTELAVFVDADLLVHDVVWAAAGTPNDNFGADPAALVAAAGGEVVVIARRDPVA